MQDTHAAGRRLFQTGKGGGTAAADTAADATLLTLSIAETAGGTTTTLSTATISRPCYLVDLQGVTGVSTGALRLNGGARSVTWDGAGNSMTYANIHNAAINSGQTMATWPAITTWQAGSVHEAVVTGANAHPLHIHVNPFQITAMPAASYKNNYFKVGDWHDTLMLTDLGANGAVTVRTQMDKYTGKAVIHCHILEHEDEGMMAWIDIQGTEGATYNNSRTIDSTCVNTAWSGASTTATTTTTSGADATVPTVLVSLLLGMMAWQAQ